jgi:hypothetical protein
LILRKLFGMGTPRGLQKEGDIAATVYLLIWLMWRVGGAWIRDLAAIRASRRDYRPRWPAFAQAG